jgi:hypothetical protein
MGTLPVPPNTAIDKHLKRPFQIKHSDQLQVLLHDLSDRIAAHIAKLPGSYTKSLVGLHQLSPGQFTHSSLLFHRLGVLTMRAVENVNLRHLFQVDAAYQRHGAIAARACYFGCVGCGHGEVAHDEVGRIPDREVQFRGRNLALAEQSGFPGTLGCRPPWLGISVALLWTKAIGGQAADQRRHGEAAR